MTLSDRFDRLVQSVRRFWSHPFAFQYQGTCTFVCFHSILSYQNSYNKLFRYIIIICSPWLDIAMVQASCLSLTLAEGWGIHTFLLPTYNSMSIFNNNNCKLLLLMLGSWINSWRWRRQYLLCKKKKKSFENVGPGGPDGGELLVFRHSNSIE